MAIASQRLTLEAFLRLPEQEPPLEFWHGEVTQKMPPMGPHGAIQYGFGRRIDDDPVRRRSFRIFTETRLIFAGVTTVPDLIVYRRDRVPQDAQGQVAEYFRTPPDLAVEILSPGQSRTRLLAHCRWYVLQGIRLVIFADSRRRTVRLFRPGQESGDLRRAELLDLTDVLPGFSLTVDEFFAPTSVDWV